jgi:hypothetical protein
MIMVGNGTVEACLDLSQLDASDLTVSEDGKSMTVNLPPVTILTEGGHILSSNKDDTYIYALSAAVGAKYDNANITVVSAPVPSVEECKAAK